MMEYGLLLLSVICTSAALLAFKKVAISIATTGGAVKLVKSLFSRYLVITAVLVVTGALAYIIAINRLDLAVAFSFTSLSYILVLLGAWLIIKERINIYHLVGVAGIVIGLVVFNWGVIVR